MMNIFSSVYVAIAGATILFMIGNMVAGIVIARRKDGFELQVFKESIIKYLGLLLVYTIMYLGLKLLSNGAIEMFDINLPIQEIISLGLLDVMYKYFKDVRDKSEELKGIEKNEYIEEIIGEE